MFLTIHTRRTTVSGKNNNRVVASRIGAGEERKLDFTPSNRAGLGFTDEDSAGQSNIFAVEPKQYVSDSNTSSSVGGPAIAGAVAVGLILAGIRIITTDEAAEVVAGPDAGLQSLGAYAEMLAVKAPVAEVEAAPAVN